MDWVEAKKRMIKSTGGLMRKHTAHAEMQLLAAINEVPA